MSGIDFGEESSASNSYPLKPDSKPQICFLTEVKFEPDYEIKNGKEAGTKKACITVTFVNKDGDRSSTMRYFDPTNDKDPQMAYKRIKDRMNEIHFVYTGKNYTKEDFAGVDSSEKAFEVMVRMINEGGEGKTPIYKQGDKPIPVWLIPVYFNNNVTLPMFGFIEKWVQNKAPMIQVNPDYHQVEMTKREKKGGNSGSGGNGGFTPDANTDYDDLPM